jgi:Tol biopolymer transport system component
MKGRTRIIGLLVLFGLLVILLSIGSSVWGQKKPSPPPANPAIVYVMQKAWGHTNLMVVDEDGRNETTLINGISGAGYGNHDPCWSPDGSYITFARTDGGVTPVENGIYKIKKDGTGLCKITPTACTPVWGLGGVPKWAPITNLILYFDAGPILVDGNSCPGGSVVSSLPALWGSTTWSPDGYRFATVIDNPPGGDRLDVLLFDLYFDTDNGRWTAMLEKNLTQTGPLSGASLGDVDWAKSSERIALAATLPGESNPDIWVIYLNDPGNPVNLTMTPGVGESDPCWSPLDTKIAYLRDNSIYVMTSTGANQSRIAPSKPTNLRLMAPDWRRNP